MRNRIFLLLTLSINLAFPQETSTKLKVTESVPYKDEVKTNSILAIYTSKTDQTGIIRNSKKSIVFDVFDKDLKKVFFKTIESDKKERYVGDLFFGDEIKFFTVYSLSKNERILFCHIFNLKDKDYKKVQLFETTVEKNQSLFSGKNKRQTSFAISPNGNYFVIATDNIKKNINSYTIRVYNSDNLDLIFEKAYQEHEERYFEPNSISINDNEEVFALGKLFKEGRSQKKNGEANYEFVLNKITKDKNDELSINLDDEHIQSLDIVNLNDQLHLLGFYSEKNVYRLKGSCNFVIDTDNFTVKDKKIYKLPNQVYEDLYGYRKAEKKGEKELSSFTVDYVLNDSEGNTFLLAEEFYVTSSYVSTGTMGGYWITTFHYDDILILKFNPDGEFDWGRSIFKRATTPSYNAFIKDDKLHVILNSGKNLTEKSDGRTKASQGWFESSALYDFVYSKNGDVSYDKIQNNRDKTFYMPYNGNFENNKFIMMSSPKSKKQFMILQ